MPRTVASVGREKTVATLARNLFVVDGPYSADLQRRAESALLAANPRLAKGLEPGATVVVPAVPGLGPSARATAASADLDGLLTETATRLKAAAASIENGFARSQERTEAALALIGQSRFLAAAAKALPASGPLLEEAGKALENQREAEKARRAEVAGAIDKALAELDALSKRARKAAPK
jgi:hypothetical protein